MSAIERLRREPAIAAALDTLADLPASDLRSAMLTVAAQRVESRTASDVIRQYQNDRFCAPGVVDAVRLAEVHATLLRAMADAWEPVVLSPVAPLGTSSVVGPVAQNNVVSTMRLTDVASDPTNALALEASVRRRLGASTETVRLCGTQRVVRAQRFEGPVSFAHFSLLGAVSAGRDRGHRSFEVEETCRLLLHWADAIKAMNPATTLDIALTDFFDRDDEVTSIVGHLRDRSIDARVDSERRQGRGYYDHLCFKIALELDGERLEIGDGGTVPWTRDYLADRKERLVIGGLSLDRIALASPTA